MTWKFVVAQTDGTQVGELTKATQRKVMWPLDDIANISFTIDGKEPQALLPQELVTDLLVYNDGELWFRGRSGASTDAVSPAAESANMTALDYRGVLVARMAALDSSFADLDQGTIAWDLVAGAQALDGGDLGITPGAIVTDVPRTIDFTDGTMVADAIAQIAALGDGFEWEIDELLRLNAYSPQQGTDTDVVLEYGGTVVSFGRTFDPTKYGNALRYSGASTIPPVTVESAELPASPTPLGGTPGRRDMVLSDTTITDSTTLGLRAQYQLSQSDRPPASYQMVLKSGWWNPGLLWKGDTVELVLRSGRVNELSRQRVTQVEVDPGDDGGEVVTITTGVIPSDEGTALQKALIRLTLLELSQ